MNAAMNDWGPTPLPANWEAIRNQWLGAHNRDFYVNFVISLLVLWGIISFGSGLA
ncbi:hypothetical protein GCM10028825_49240 [Spirosoma agri]